MIETKQSMLSDYNEIKLSITKILLENPNCLRIKHNIHRQILSRKEIFKKEARKYIELVNNECMILKLLGC